MDLRFHLGIGIESPDESVRRLDDTICERVGECGWDVQAAILSLQFLHEGLNPMDFRRDQCDLRVESMR